jgi:hypothetical protein
MSQPGAGDAIRGLLDWKRHEAVRTPSTDCDEIEEVSIREVVPTGTMWRQTSPNGITEERLYTFSPGRRPRGLTKHQFEAAVRQPFPFPQTVVAKSCTGQGLAPIPICIICRGTFDEGESCRELRSCGHCFHSGCIESYLGQHSHCPVCRSRCRSSLGKRKSSCSKQVSDRDGGRPCWCPEYDSQLLTMSNKADSERRIYIRDDPPRSDVFLKTSLPVLLEESQEYMNSSDGSIDCLSRYLRSEKEKHLLSSMKT